MSGGPEAHESTGIIFVETQVRGGKVWLGLGAGVGDLQRPGDACLWGPGGGQTGLPNLSELFSRAARPHWGCRKPKGGGQGPDQPLYMSQCRGL